MQIGDRVRVNPPFHAFFPDNYVIERIEDVDGTPVYFLTGIEGGFAPMYLELAA